MVWEKKNDLCNNVRCLYIFFHHIQFLINQYTNELTAQLRIFDGENKRKIHESRRQLRKVCKQGLLSLVMH